MTADDLAENQVTEFCFTSRPRKARTTAEQTQHSAVVEHLSEYRSARNDGYEAGLAAGRQAAAEELQAVLTALSAAGTQLAAVDAQNTEATAELAVALAVELAAEILGRELLVDPSFGAAAVTAALSDAARDEKITLKLNPADAANLPEHPNVSVILDASLPRTFAEAHVGDGIIDLGVDAALDRVRTHLGTPARPTAVADAVSSSTPARKATTRKAPARKAAATKPATSRKTPAKKAAPRAAKGTK